MRRHNIGEVTSLPEYVAKLTEELGLQTEFRLDDGANQKASIRHVLTENAPHVNDAAGRPIEQSEVQRRTQIS